MDRPGKLRSIVREPLVHFVALGALLFAIDHAVHRVRSTSTQGPVASPVLPIERIVVDDDVRTALAREDTLRFGQPPDAARLRQMIDAWVRDEALVREGLRLGLDRGDPIVRRRLAQKMELVLESEAAIAPPADDVLVAYLAAHRDAFRLPARTSLTHVFFARDRRGDDPRTRAAALLARGGVDPSLGDAFALGNAFDRRADSDLLDTFGAPFVQLVDAAPLGTWVGPVESRYGAHLVLVRAREAARDPDLSEVRASVLSAWTSSARAEAVRTATQRLVARYGVTTREATP